MSTQYTLDDARNQVGAYVPSPTTVSPDDWEQLRPTVTQMVIDVFTYADKHPHTVKLTRDNVTNFLTVLTGHTARILAEHGSLDDVDLFDPETIAWSVNQLHLKQATKEERKRHLTTIGNVLTAIGTRNWKTNARHADEQYKPYSPDEVSEIIRSLDAQSTPLKRECVRVAVTLGLAGVTTDEIILIRARDVHDGFTVSVDVNGRTHAIAPSLSDRFLQIVHEREPDEFVFCPSRKRDPQAVSEYMYRFKRGPNLPPVNVRRLVATWRVNLIKSGISYEAFHALTGKSMHIYQRTRAIAPLDTGALVEFAAIATDLTLTGRNVVSDSRVHRPEEPSTKKCQPTELTIIEGGRN